MIYLREGVVMSKNYNDVGIITAPSDFEYDDAIHQGKPLHIKFDDFYKKHPFMDMSKRAKIFSSFDALKGFSEATGEKEVQYQLKIILDEESQTEISKKLNTLHILTINSRRAKVNNIEISVTYFVPCSDKNHEAYGYRGS